jgi:hypothetical protein
MQELSYLRTRSQKAWELSKEHLSWWHPTLLTLVTFGVDTYRRGWNVATTDFLGAVTSAGVFAATLYGFGMYALQWIVSAPRRIHDEQQSELTTAREEASRAMQQLQRRQADQRIVAALMPLRREGIKLLNVTPPDDPGHRGLLQNDWMPDAIEWDQRVHATMVEVGCTVEETAYVWDFVLGDLRTTNFLYPMNSQWTISDMRRERLEKVIDDHLERPIFRA